MPTPLTYPGVYVEEVPSPVRTIAGVATSITAFVGRTLKGEVDTPVRVQSFAEFDRKFGGLWRESPLSYAVQQYFANGGSDAIIVRVFNPGAAPLADHIARLDVGTTSGTGTFEIEAMAPGAWGNELRVQVDHDTDPDLSNVFNLTVGVMQDGQFVALESFRNVSIWSSDPRYVEKVLEEGSELIRAPGAAADTTDPTDNASTVGVTPLVAADSEPDGDPVGHNQIGNPGLASTRQGIWALEDADIFNLLVIPPYDFTTDVVVSTWTEALTYCKGRRAMLLIDPPAVTGAWNDPSDVESGGAVDTTNIAGPDPNATVFFPRVRIPDPLQENRLETFAPAGAVAGVFARTDTQRGVWKAPAGQDASLVGVREFAYSLTDGEIGQLNPLGVNCLRPLPAAGPVVWGARTMVGADRLANQWKYTPIRRLALFIEESLYRGTQWVIFEPNDEPLWSQIRLNVGAFMNNLFRQGAFQGSKARDAYFVKCDQETTTQNDIDRGIVNLLVGFAPLKPAEFLVIKISQMAGNIQT